jgi:hypothetical protein
MTRRNAKPLGKLQVTHFARIVKLPDFANDLIANLWLELCRKGVSPFGDGISVVLEVAAKEKMGWVDAKAVIALVEDTYAFGNCAYIQLIRQSMSPTLTAAYEVSVLIWFGTAACCLPKPTSVWLSWLKLLFESCHEIYLRSSRHAPFIAIKRRRR